MKRNIVLCVILSIVTCGIYSIYWFIVLTNEINRESWRNEDLSGGVSFILTLITFGLFGLYWAYKMGEKVDILGNRHKLNAGEGGTKILYLIIELLGFNLVNLILCQYELNNWLDYSEGKSDKGEWKLAN